MIVFRYLARDLVSATAAVAAVLLLVIISGRFIRLLADAAAGNIDPGILFAVIGYRLPGFLELILPLAFFLGVLLAYGRMYIDSEMTVLSACGFSQRRLVAYTMVVATGVALLAGWLSIWISPAGIARSEALLDTQKLRGEFASIEAGKFYPYGDGRGVTYTETKDADGTMHGVFLTEAGRGSGAQPRAPIIVLAENGSTRKAQADGGNFLVLENGYRIQGIPGQTSFQITSFKEYGQRLTPPQVTIGQLQKSAVPTKELLNLNGPEDIATLQWRLSVPVLVLVVTLIAVPLSHTNPRSGRYGKIFPAMFLYILYLVILSGARGAVGNGKLPAVVGLWGVHLLFFAVAAALLAWNAGWRPSLARGERR